MLSAAISMLYKKVETYNLQYRDSGGSLKPVRFGSYIWKRIDGLALDYLKKERMASGIAFRDVGDRLNYVEEISRV